jgi:hypothetical protein
MLHRIGSTDVRIVQLTPRHLVEQTERVRAALTRHHGVPLPDTDLVAYSFALPRDFNHAMLALYLLRSR